MTLTHCYCILIVLFPISFQFWNFIGAVLFLALGVKTIIIWADGKKLDDWAGMEQYVTNYR